MRPSTTKIGKWLHEAGYVDKPFTTRDLKRGVRGVTDETFGRDSRLFLHFAKSPEERAKLVRFLERKGVTTIDHGSNYGNRVDVGVTYFRGWHWDE